MINSVLSPSVSTPCYLFTLNMTKAKLSVFYFFSSCCLQNVLLVMMMMMKQALVGFEHLMICMSDVG